MNRFLAAIAILLLGGAASQAQKAPCATPGQDNSFLGIRTIRLWPGDAPEAKGTSCEDIPALSIFEPQPGHDNGSAVVIFPGGAYAHLAGNLEGRQVADWFTARGFRAFVLSYRLSSNGYLLPVPLLDARRAVQTVRARSARLLHRAESYCAHRLLRRRPPRRSRLHAASTRQSRLR